MDVQIWDWLPCSKRWFRRCITHHVCGHRVTPKHTKAALPDPCRSCTINDHPLLHPHGREEAGFQTWGVEKRLYGRFW